MDTAQKAIIQLQEISTRYLENEMEVIENAY
jgi:hypothetical protein